MNFLHILLPLYGFQLPFVAVKNMGHGAEATKYLLAENQKGVTDYYIKESAGTVYDPSGLLKEFGIAHGSVINNDDFKALSSAFNPKTGEALLAVNGDKHRAGTDFAFSPPKSFSALWAVSSPQIRQSLERINRASVVRGLDHLNNHAVTRTGHGGSEKIAIKFAAIQFQHSTSRENDPHLHLHNAVLNLSKSADGQWRSIDPRSLMNWQTSSDSVYQADLIAQLKAEFPGIEIKKSDNGHSFEVVGVPNGLVNDWSTRRESILNAAEKDGISIDDAGGLDRKFYETRIKKVTMSEDPHINWQAFGAKKHGFGERESKVLLDAKPGEKKALSSFEFGLMMQEKVTEVVEKLLENESAFKLNALHRAIAEEFYGVLDAEKIDIVIDSICGGDYELSQNDAVVKLGEFDGMPYFSSKSMVAIEANLVELSTKLGTDSAHKIDDDLIEKAIKNQKVLSQEQADLVRHLCTDGSLKVGEGAAGSGKSTAALAAANAFKSAGYKIQGLGVSYEAAKILGDSANIEHTAIAKFIKEVVAGKIKIDNKTVLMIDESGLLGSKDAGKLLSMIDKAGAKAVFLGEEAQLNAVAAGPALSLIIESAGSASINTIRRQRSEVQREMVANFRVGHADLAINALNQEGGLSLHKTADTTKRALIEEWAKFTHSNKNKTATILAIKNADVKTLNEMAREILKERGQFTSDDVSIKVHGSKSAYKANFASGDAIVLRKNSDDIGVKNKDKAIITSIRSSANGGHIVTAKLDSGLEIKIDTSKYKDEATEGAAFNHNYAQTAFSSQGDTKDAAFVLSEGMDRRYAYVSMSRHRDSVKLFVNEGAIKTSLKSSGKTQTREDVMVALATQLNKKSDKFSTTDFNANKIESRRKLAQSEQKQMLARMSAAAKAPDNKPELYDLTRQIAQAALAVQARKEKESVLTLK